MVNTNDVIVIIVVILVTVTVADSVSDVDVDYQKIEMFSFTFKIFLSKKKFQKLCSIQISIVRQKVEEKICATQNQVRLAGQRCLRFRPRRSRGNAGLIL